MTQSMPRVLVVFAHPAFHKSRINRALVQSAINAENVTFHDLYEKYPTFDIDVAHEQNLLATHDIVILQHPLYWYSAPALIKEWIDLVFAYGWAYGPGGNALAGKSLLNATTTGGSEGAYQASGHNRYTLQEFLRPFEQTARLCGMSYLPPFAIHGTIRLIDADELASYADDYARVLAGLAKGTLNANECDGWSRINLPRQASA